jgi:D-3-phosphoglycerate dehydrogenase
MAYKVVITDFGFPDLSIEQEVLGPLGIIPLGAQCKTEQEVAALAADADAVLVGFAPVRATAIGAMKKARVIVRFGIGVDNVDLAAAKARNIPVCNVPDYCLDEVADHTLAFVLALTRQIVRNAVVIHQGLWKSAVPASGFHCLRNMTVGVVGFGRIGRAVAQRLTAFGCSIVIHDPAIAVGSGAPPNMRHVSFEELLETSDLVTLHVPSMPATRGLINRERLGRMKAGALLVNTSRGDLVVTEDLIEALRGGRLAGAGLDVTNPEPLPAESPLRGFPQVIINAHLASVSPQAQRRLRVTASELAAAAVQGKPLKNVVNGV